MRVSQYLWGKRVLWRLSNFLKRLNEVLTGFECHLEARIGRGLNLPHTQNLVVGAGVVLGRNTTLYNGITLGAVKRGKEGGEDGRYPVLGDNVIVYTGAKIIGPVQVGEAAIIGANSVVLKDVPPGAIAVGIPARILSQTDPEHRGTRV
jgi:serine O-acetyltransferase